MPSQSASTATAPADDIRPYTPGLVKPANAVGPGFHVLAADEAARQAVYAAQLANPNRIVFTHARAGTARPESGVVHDVSPQANIIDGNGEAIGMWVQTGFTAQGSITNMGVQPNYVLSGPAAGGVIYHTHMFPTNACFEYGVMYTGQGSFAFLYNWCTGGNTPQGFMNLGLVGSPGGLLSTWTKNGYMVWDSNMQIDKIAMEEVLYGDGSWHLLGYHWATYTWYDLLGGYGITGTKGNCCGWDVFEEHFNNGTPCNFDPSFPTGQHLIYDFKKHVLLNGQWHYMDAVPSAGVTYKTTMDCADIGNDGAPGYVSPYYSGEYYPTAQNSWIQWQYADDWWMTAR